MIRRSLVSIYLIILFSLPASHAQILNIEKVDTVTAGNTWFGRFSFSGNVTKKQDALVELRNTSYVVYKNNEFKSLLINRLDFLTDDGNDVLSQGFIHARLTYWNTQPIAAEAFIQVQYDAVRGLERRDLVGLVGRFQLFEGHGFHLSTTAGGMLEHESWQVNNVRLKQDLLKTSFSLQTGYTLNSFSFAATGYYQAPFDNILKPRAILDAVAEVDITDSWAVGFSYSMLYDFSPVLNIEALNYDSGVELTYSF